MLIHGESGTGKELVANAIHHNSPRRDHPFVKVNCAALPETLLENELFGHEKGAFTGAVGPKKGRFQLADRGTLFLDEIAEMAPATQAKILRVLQEREFEPVGGTRTVQVDTRIISATNRHLEDDIASRSLPGGSLLSTQCGNDQGAAPEKSLGRHPSAGGLFSKPLCRKERPPHQRLQPRAMDLLLRHTWPGNVRELENVIERAVIMARGDVIVPEHFPGTLQDHDGEGPVREPVLASGRSLKEVEKEMILKTLADMGGNRTRTAEVLGISRRTLQLKLKVYGTN